MYLIAVRSYRQIRLATYARPQLTWSACICAWQFPGSRHLSACELRSGSRSTLRVYRTFVRRSCGLFPLEIMIGVPPPFSPEKAQNMPSWCAFQCTSIVAVYNSAAHFPVTSFVFHESDRNWSNGQRSSETMLLGTIAIALP
jgi:hypothetical protein